MWLPFGILSITLLVLEVDDDEAMLVVVVVLMFRLLVLLLLVLMLAAVVLTFLVFPLSVLVTDFAEESMEEAFSSFRSFNWLRDFLSCFFDSLSVKFSLFVVRWPKPWNFDLFNRPLLEKTDEGMESNEVFS